jgi:hypothetical protein
MGCKDDGSSRHLFKQVHPVRAIQGNHPKGNQCFDSVTVVNDLTEDMDWARDSGVFDRLLDHLEGIDHPIAITSGANLDHFHRHIPLPFKI